MTVSERLRQERERLGLRQSELAKSCGVDRRTQVNYEAGEREPKADYLVLAAELGVDVLYVITGNRSRTTPVPAALEGLVFTTAGNVLVLTAEERSLVDNYRHASDAGRKRLRQQALRSRNLPRPRTRPRPDRHDNCGDEWS